MAVLSIFCERSRVLHVHESKGQRSASLPILFISQFSTFFSRYKIRGQIFFIFVISTDI